MRRRAFLVLLLALGVAATASGCKKQANPPTVVTPPQGESTSTVESSPTPLTEITLSVEAIVTDLDQPLYVTGAGDGSGRLFVVEKSGRVFVMRGADRAQTPFLDIADKISEGSEQGLLGLAFPPDFPAESWCVVNYTSRDGTSIISRFTVQGDTAQRDSEEVLLRLPQPYANHNGGMLVFGPDGYLYAGFGDGGSGGDPHGNGQDLGTLLGKLLRIDARKAGNGPYAIPPENPFVSKAGAKPEIWAYGLRNPWRFSFDRKTGDLWIGDVGQDTYEEIDFQPASSAGGEDYGWNLYEGAHTYPGGQPVTSAPGMVLPVVEYDHSAGESVTGGYVYRGTRQKALAGTYLYADFASGRIWGLQRTGTGVENRELLDTDLLISSFGEDDDGELYLTDLNGGLYRVVAK
jgi:glucose/arabinose dehydrogenase